MLEKEIETKFIDWAIEKTDYSGSNHCYKYMGRQVKLPMGIIDVLLFNYDGSRAGIDVVEIKREPATIKALAQVLGYMGQIEEMVEYFCEGPNGEMWWQTKNNYWGKTRPVIVAPDIEGELMMRCLKADVFEFIQCKISDNDVSFEILPCTYFQLAGEDDLTFRREVYQGYIGAIEPALSDLTKYRWHDFGDLK